MRAAPAFLLLLLLPACLDNDSPDGAPSPSGPTPGSLAFWSTKAAMPVPRTEVTCVALEDAIYTVGGFEATNTATNLFHRYDLATDTWTRLAAFPITIHHTGLVAHDGDVWAFGGYTGNFPFAGTNTVWRYDTASDTWSLADTLPRMRGAHATVKVEENVYLIGGAPNQPGPETYGSVDVYSFATGEFRNGPALSMTREHLAGAAALDTVVAVGGRRMSLSNFGTTETLPSDASAWTERDEMPTPRGGIAAASLDSSVFVFGGEGTAGTFDEVESFDVRVGTWTSWPLLPQPRHGLCAATLSDGIHVIAGGPEPGLSVSDQHDVLSIQAQ